jgi:hypothetical protein
MDVPFVSCLKIPVLSEWLGTTRTGGSLVLISFLFSIFFWGNPEGLLLS